jgi:hypothetical protein
MKVENKRQPMKASMLPGMTKGNTVASKASSMAKSKLPGEVIHMEAGADPNRKAEHCNGLAGDASHVQIEGATKMRTVTSRDCSPYDVR